MRILRPENSDAQDSNQQRCFIDASKKKKRSDLNFFFFSIWVPPLSLCWSPLSTSLNSDTQDSDQQHCFIDPSKKKEKMIWFEFFFFNLGSSLFSMLISSQHPSKFGYPGFGSTTLFHRSLQKKKRKKNPISIFFFQSGFSTVIMLFLQKSK